MLGAAASNKVQARVCVPIKGIPMVQDRSCHFRGLLRGRRASRQDSTGFSYGHTTCRNKYAKAGSGEKR